MDRICNNDGEMEKTGIPVSIRFHVLVGCPRECLYMGIANVV
jgi:hypothetical protein